ncbi:MAG: dihydrofolate reductase [Planctomycetota bacterium]
MTESENRHRIVMIAAVADNGVIASGDDLPWRLPEDLKRFKAVTSGHAVIMGRKTFATLPGALSSRHNIVLSRSLETAPPESDLARTREEALQIAIRGSCSDHDRVYIVGGGEIYRLFLDLADELDITRVHAQPTGDVLFPSIEPSRWHRASSEPQGQPPAHSTEFTYERWIRATA